MTHAKLVLPLLLTAFALPSSAQAPGLQVNFKVGWTPALGGGGDQHAKTAWTMGGELAYPFARGQVFAGLSYRLFRPVEYECTQTGTGYVPGGTTGQITRYVLTNGYPVTNYKLDSADWRKNNLEGFTLSAGYRIPLWARMNLMAQGGLSLSALQSQQALNTAIRVVDPAVRNATTIPSTATPLYSQELFMQTQQTKVRPGAFLGVRSQVTREFFFETNIACLGYATTNYVPYAYTGQADHVEVINRTKTVVEFCAGLTF